MFGFLKKKELKQVILIRSDLKMGKGKIAVQASHASLLAYLDALKKNKSLSQQWIEEGMKKIVLKVGSEEELVKYYEEAVKEGMPCSFVRDAGLTQIRSGEATAVAIGPCEGEKVDKLTKNLPLL